jgi:hypothetical protein
MRQATTTYLLSCTVFVWGCTLPLTPEVPIAPEPVQLVMQEPTPPWCPLYRVEVTLLPSRSEPSLARPRPGLPGKKAARALTPSQVVAQAQQAARVEPTERGYYGGSAEMVYAWTPGKVYTVYLTKKHGTGLFLPPGERLVSGLYLDGEAYEVKHERAGRDLTAYDALTIRPLVDKGEVDTFILTESGRRYLLHFVVGTTGMLAVTFEGPRVGTHARAVEPALVLPRPPQ